MNAEIPEVTHTHEGNVPIHDPHGLEPVAQADERSEGGGANHAPADAAESSRREKADPHGENDHKTGENTNNDKVKDGDSNNRGLSTIQSNPSEKPHEPSKSRPASEPTSPYDADNKSEQAEEPAKATANPFATFASSFGRPLGNNKSMRIFSGLTAAPKSPAASLTPSRATIIATSNSHGGTGDGGHGNENSQASGERNPDMKRVRRAWTVVSPRVPKRRRQRKSGRQQKRKDLSTASFPSQQQTEHTPNHRSVPNTSSCPAPAPLTSPTSSETIDQIGQSLDSKLSPTQTVVGDVASGTNMTLPSSTSDSVASEKDTKPAKKKKQQARRKRKTWVPMSDLPEEEQRHAIKRWHSLIASNGSTTIEQRRYQLFVAARVHAQCHETAVRKALERIHQKFPGFTVDMLAKSDPKDLASCMTNVQYHNAKARHIVEASKDIVSKFHGCVPADQPSLLQLKGIGKVLADLLATVNAPHVHHEMAKATPTVTEAETATKATTAEAPTDKTDRDCIRMKTSTG